MTRFPSWRMADGHRIPIHAMADQHLINTLRMLEHQAQQAVEAIPFPQFQGEMAQWTAEQDWYAARVEGPEPTHPRYPDLVREAARRALDW